MLKIELLTPHDRMTIYLFSLFIILRPARFKFSKN